MREKTQSFKRDNRGLTLVELLCTVAIFVCIMTGIGSVLVVTAKTYQKGTTEAALQQEAQNAVNVIEGIIVDAQDAVNYYCTDTGGAEHKVVNETEAFSKGASLDTNRRLEVMNGGAVQYNIAYIASEDKLYYQNLADSTELFLLAEDVKAFNVDVSDFGKSNNVLLGIEMEKGERKFRSNYNVTARNDEVVAGSYALSKWAIINATPAEIILEPNELQTFTIEHYVYDGGTDDFDYIMSGNTSSGTTLSRVGDTLHLTVGNDETGGVSNIIWINVKSKALDDTGLPLDSEYIKVYIRRVDGISLAMTQAGGATQYEAGAVYTITPTLTATPYLARETGEPLPEYKNPRYVKWDYEFSIAGHPTAWGTYFNIEEYEDVDSPYVKITLLQEMPTGGKLTVTGAAKHPTDGAYNKRGIIYNSSVVDSVNFIRAGVPPVHPGDPSTLLRGDDFMDFGAIASLTLNKPQNCEYRIFWRYRVDNGDGTYGDWTSYHRTVEGGLEQKINANESYCLLPNKAYEIEMIQGAYSGTKLKWPADPWLLDSTDGYTTGFEGFTADWNAADETTLASYAIRFTVGATYLKYSESESGASPVESVGTETSPYVLTGNKDWYFVTPWLHKEKVSSYVKYIVEYRATETDAWTSYGSISSWAQHDNKGLKFSNISNATDGYYRIGIYLENYPLKVITGDILNPVVSNGSPSTVTVPLYDFSTGAGVMYLKVE